MKVINFIYKHNTKKYIIITSLLALIGMVLIFTQYFGLVTLSDDKALDMLFTYNSSKFYNILHILTESDRLAYKLIHLADYIFIVGIYPLISLALSKVINMNKKKKVLIMVPLIAGLFDMLENIMMDIHLYFYSNEFLFLGNLSGVFTTIKFLSLYLSVIILVIFSVIKLVKK